MATVRRFQTNFSSGEVDPLLLARTDTASFQNGARKLRNVSLLATGGVIRRPGTRHTGAQLSGPARLQRWQFSVAERYVVAFSHRRASIYDFNGNYITALTDCPWTSETLATLQTAQAADTMIVVHQRFPPHVIKRTGLTRFALERLVFSESVNGDLVYQPYYKFADDKTTLTPSGDSGAITLRASGPVFREGHLGTRFRWKGVEVEITEILTETQAKATVKGKLEGRYDIDPFRVTSGSSVVEVTHVAHGFITGTIITISGANDTGGIPATALNGARQITVIDDNTYSFVAGASPGAAPVPPATTGSTQPDYTP